MTTDELKPCPFCGLPAQIHGDFNMEALSCSDRTGDCPGSWAALSCRTPPQRAEAISAWNRRAQPEPAASADPSRDAYEGCREDLLDWKRRALKAEETCRQLTRALGDEVNGADVHGRARATCRRAC